MHVGIMGLYDTPLRWEEAKEKTCLWHMPVQDNPFGTGIAWPAAQPGQDQQRKAVLLCCPSLFSCAVPRASLISPLRVLNKSLMNEVVLASS